MNRELLKKNFEAHGFVPVFFDTKEEAVTYLTGELKGKKIAFGGSVTVQQMGLAEALSEENEVIWHWMTPGPETLKKAREAEIYITSANAVSETGELVNIDGTGNRVAQTLFGPQKTYFVVGSNKVSPDLSAAMDRQEMWRRRRMRFVFPDKRHVRRPAGRSAFTAAVRRISAMRQ